jgi:hypothetical protein
MQLQHTDKARRELTPSRHALSLCERSLLLLADNAPLSTVQALYHGIGSQMVAKLLRQGYLQGSVDLPPGKA